MALTILTETIGKELIRLINTNAGLGVITAQLGSLFGFPTTDSLASILPAVLVRPVKTSNEWRTTSQFRSFESFRIVYLQAFAAQQDRVAIMLQKGKAIVDALSATVKLDGLALTPPQQIEVHWVSEVDWEPEENLFPTIAQSPIAAIALTDTVRVLT